MRVIVLMSRLSDYMLNCFSAWQEHSGVELHVMRRAPDPAQAPFDFAGSGSGIAFYDRADYAGGELKNFVAGLGPQLIICFGWADPEYLHVVRTRARSTRAVMTMDNRWRGTPRQMAGILWSRLGLARHFDFAWVPGDAQRRFARLLGFPETCIEDGLYVANAENFTPLWHSHKGAPLKRLIYVGRYVRQKGLDELWQAFTRYHAATSSSLELICAGTGPLENEWPDHPNVKHLGFLQPADFREALAGGGILVLPSHYEPWGVVVQEFALAGFPLVLSRAVGAGERFLGEDNGLRLERVAPPEIMKSIAAVDALGSDDLAAMSAASRRRAASLTVADWVARADRFLGSTPERREAAE